MNENIPFVGVGHSVDVVERVSEVETATPEVQVDPEPLSEVVRPVNAARSAAGRLGETGSGTGSTGSRVRTRAWPEGRSTASASTDSAWSAL